MAKRSSATSVVVACCHSVLLCIQAGHHVCGSVRQLADGERLCAEFGKAFTPLLFDVTDIRAVRKASEQVNHGLVHITFRIARNRTLIKQGTWPTLSKGHKMPVSSNCVGFTALSNSEK